MPNPRAISLTDIDQLRALFSNWRGKFEQLSAGRFAATLQVVRGERVRAIAIDANQRVILRGADGPDRFSIYPVTNACGTSLWQGRRLDPGQFVLNGPDTESDHCSGRIISSRGLSLRQEELESAARVLLNRDDLRVPRTWSVCTPAPAEAEAFQRSLGVLMSDRGTDLRSPEGRLIEEDCIRTLVDALFAQSTLQPRVPLSVRAKIVRKAEDFMRSRMADPPGTLELCQELGVSDRTLRLAFRERYGSGPIAFLAFLRLNAVRAKLKSDAEASIARVASDFGFQHMGNFAAAYRRLFGERPVDTRAAALRA
jgi:AraC family ethanolamine operon transcriptional activator